MNDHFENLDIEIRGYIGRLELEFLEEEPFLRNWRLTRDEWVDGFLNNDFNLTELNEIRFAAQHQRIRLFLSGVDPRLKIIDGIIEQKLRSKY